VNIYLGAIVPDFGVIDYLEETGIYVHGDIDTIFTLD